MFTFMVAYRYLYGASTKTSLYKREAIIVHNATTQYNRRDCLRVLDYPYVRRYCKLYYIAGYSECVRVCIEPTHRH